MVNSLFSKDVYSPSIFLGPHPLPSQVFHFVLVSSSLAIPSTCSTIEYKYEKIEGCEQSKPCIVTRIFQDLESLAENLTSSKKLVRTFELNP